MNVLFIYSLVPENIKYFVIPEKDLPSDILCCLALVNGKTVNVDNFTEEESDAAIRIDDETAEDGFLSKYEVAGSSLKNAGQNIDKVYILDFFV